jgi:hypothetical protein
MLAACTHHKRWQQLWTCSAWSAAMGAAWRATKPPRCVGLLVARCALHMQWWHAEAAGVQACTAAHAAVHATRRLAACASPTACTRTQAPTLAATRKKTRWGGRGRPLRPLRRSAVMHSMQCAWTAGNTLACCQQTHLCGCCAVDVTPRRTRGVCRSGWAGRTWRCLACLTVTGRRGASSATACASSCPRPWPSCPAARCAQQRRGRCAAIHNYTVVIQLNVAACMRPPLSPAGCSRPAWRRRCWRRSQRPTAS